MAKWQVALLTVAVVSASGTARAEPQANVGLTVGVAGTGEGEYWSDTRFSLGAHGDVLFLRRRNADWGVGPFAEVLSAMNDLQLGGGGSVLVPVHSDLPIVLSGGGYGRYTDAFGWEPGVSGQVFWGSRSYNFSSWYVMAGGLTVQGRFGLGDSEERSIVVAAHIDGEVLALPFVFAYELVRGSRR